MFGWLLPRRTFPAGDPTFKAYVFFTRAILWSPAVIACLLVQRVAWTLGLVLTVIAAAIWGWLAAVGVYDSCRYLARIQSGRR